MLILVILLSAVLLFCFGVLCGSSWAYETQRVRDRKQAAFQRQLNSEWRAIQAARQELRSS
jgi:preprotein translocase subunit Sec63